jgi:ATP-dependent protease Clp ATPase subunit
MHDEGRDESHCVLCGREIRKLILGVHGGICIDCVYLCLEIIQKDKAQSSAPAEINREVASIT